eukprot:g3763.t1
MTAADDVGVVRSFDVESKLEQVSNKQEAEVQGVLRPATTPKASEAPAASGGSGGKVRKRRAGGKRRRMSMMSGRTFVPEAKASFAALDALGLDEIIAACGRLKKLVQESEGQSSSFRTTKAELLKRGASVAGCKQLAGKFKFEDQRQPESGRAATEGVFSEFNRTIDVLHANVLGALDGASDRSLARVAYAREQRETQKAALADSFFFVISQIGDWLYLMYDLRDSAPTLYLTSLTFLGLNMLCRALVLLYAGMWRRRVHAKKRCRYSCGVIVSLVEPFSGMTLVSDSLRDDKASKEEKIWNDETNQWDFRPVGGASARRALRAHMDARLEVGVSAVVFFLGDVPALGIQLYHAVRSPLRDSPLAIMNLLSTILSLAWIISTRTRELWRLYRHDMPAIEQIREDISDVKEKCFDKGDGDAAVEKYAKRAHRRARHVTVAGSAVTDVGMKALATKCRGLEYVDVSNCENITEGGLKVVARECHRIEVWRLATRAVKSYTQFVTEGVLQAIGSGHAPGGARLKKLYCYGCEGITDSGVKKLATGCPRLEILELGKCTAITDNALGSIARLPCLAQLKLLHVSDCNHITGNGVQRIAEGCQKMGHTCKLCYVRLSGCTQVTDESVAALAQSCPGLKQIRLNRCKLVGYKSMAAFAESCQVLEVLEVEHCPEVKDNDVVALAQCQGQRRGGQLTILRLGPNIGDKSVGALAEHCRHLERVCLSQCAGISDAGVMSLTDGCGKIQRIELAGCCSLTDEGIETVVRCLKRDCVEINLGDCGALTAGSVKALARCTQLRTAKLYNCTGMDGSCFAQLKACTELRTLDLSGTHVDDQSIREIVDHCKHIEKLLLEGC